MISWPNLAQTTQKDSAHKQELADYRRETNARFADVDLFRKEVTGILKAVDTQVQISLEKHSFFAREQYWNDVNDLKARISALEEAERKRRGA